MSTGSRKSLHFGPIEDTIPNGAPRPTRHREESRPIPGSTPNPGPNPLLLMGDLLRDCKLVGDELRTLHLDEAQYHGNLQVILSALKRMQAHVTAMIEQCES